MLNGKFIPVIYYNDSIDNLKEKYSEGSQHDAFEEAADELAIMLEELEFAGPFYGIIEERFYAISK